VVIIALRYVLEGICSFVATDLIIDVITGTTTFLIALGNTDENNSWYGFGGHSIVPKTTSANAASASP